MAEDQIAVDPDFDSALDVPLEEPSTSSLRSSLLQFSQENGRTYHKLSEGKYAFPNDDAENDRLDLQDNLYLITLDGKRALNPGADNATRVLDMGTGTGLWALEFADEHPAAEVSILWATTTFKTDRTGYWRRSESDSTTICAS
jgi:hypothetical protein